MMAQEDRSRMPIEEQERRLRIRSESQPSSIVGSVGATTIDRDRDVVTDFGDNIQVFCRFRPFMRYELSGEDKKTKCCVAFHKSGKNALLKHGVDKPSKYDFDRVFQPSSTQENIFDVVGASIVQGITEGNNHVVLSCGAPSSGKTFLLLGSNSDWNEAETVQVNDGLIIRCARAIFDYINDAHENDEFTIQICIARVSSEHDNPVTFVGLQDTYVESVLDIARHLSLSQSSGNTTGQSPSSSESTFYNLKLSQTNSSTNTTRSSSLCFIDLKIEDIASLASLVELQDNGSQTLSPIDNTSETGSGIIRLVQEYTGGRFKLCLIGNCSPHVNNAEQTKNTMEIISSSSLTDKQSRYAPHTTTTPENDVSPVNSPQMKPMTRSRGGSINANLLTLDNYRGALDKLKKEKKKLLLRMAVSSFKEASLTHEIQVLRQEAQTYSSEKEQMKNKLNSVILALHMVKSEQTELKTKWRDSILHTQDLIIDDFSSVFIDREKEFTASLSDMSTRYQNLQVEIEKLNKDKEDLTAEKNEIEEILKRERHNRKAEYDELRKRAWDAEENSTNIAVESKELQSVLAITKEEYEIAMGQIKDIQEQIGIVSDERDKAIETRNVLSSEMDKLRAMMEEMEREKSAWTEKLRVSESSWDEERTQLGLKITRLENELNETVHSSQQRVIEFTTLQQKLVDLEREKDEALGEWSLERENLQRRIEELDLETQRKEESIVELLKQIESSQKEKESWEEEKTRLQLQIEAHQQDVATWAEEKQHLSNRVESLTSVTESYDQLKEQFVGIQANNEELNNQIVELQTTYEIQEKKLNETIEQLSFENKDVRDQLLLLKEQLLTYQAGQEEWEKQQQELRAENEQLRSRIIDDEERHQSSIALVRTENEEAHKSKTSLLEEEISRSRASIASLETQLEEYRLFETQWHKDKQDLERRIDESIQLSSEEQETTSQMLVCAQEENNRLASTVQSLTETITALTEERGAHFEERSSLDNRLVLLTTENEHLSSQITFLRDENSQLSASIANLNEEIARYHKEQSQWTVEKKELERTISDNQQQLSQTKLEFEQELQTLRASREEVEMKWATERQGLQMKIDTISADLTRSIDREESDRNSYHSFQLEIVKLSDTVREYESQIDALTRETDTLRQEKSSKEKTIEHLQSENEEIKASLSSVDQQLADAQSLVQQLQTESEQKTVEIETLKHDIVQQMEELQAVKQTQANEIEQLKSNLALKEQGITELQESETILEQQTSELVQLKQVVVEKEQRIEELIAVEQEYKTQLEQLTVQFTSEIEQSKKDMEEMTENHRNQLEEFVESSSVQQAENNELREEIKRLLVEKDVLGETIEQLRTSLETASSHNHKTIDEMTERHQREMKELQELVAKVQEDGDRLRVVLDEKQKALVELQEQYELLQGQQRESRELLSSVQKHESTMGAESAKLSQRLEALEAERTKILLELQQSRQEVDELREEGDMREQSYMRTQSETIVRYQEEIDSLKTSFKKLETEKMSLRDQIHTERQENARLIEQMHQYNEAREQLIQSHHEAIDRYDSQIELLKSEAEQLEKDKTVSREQLEQAQQELRSMEEQLTHMKRDNEDSQSKIKKELEERVASLTNKLRLVEQQRQEFENQNNELLTLTDSMREQLDRATEELTEQSRLYSEQSNKYQREMEQVQLSFNEMKQKMQGQEKELALLKQAKHRDAATTTTPPSSTTGTNTTNITAPTAVTTTPATALISALNQEQVLRQIQTLIYHVERMRQERDRLKTVIQAREHDFHLLKKKAEQKDGIINLLYNQISIINSTKSDQADKMQGELDQLMQVIHQSKKNLNSSGASIGSATTSQFSDSRRRSVSSSGSV